MKKILSPACSLKLKNIILFLNHSVIVFFQMIIFATLFRRCPTLWKPRLKMATLFRRCVTLFNAMLKYTTLLNVLNYNDAVCNVVSTLLWRIATPWSNINLKTTLKRRWNVSCEILLFLLYILQMLTQLKRKGVGETFLYDGKLYVG